MPYFKHLLLSAIAVVSLAHAASAQTADFTGAWTWQFGTPQGPIVSTLFFRPDGNFVRADRLSSGVMLRQWGQYSAQQVGPNSFQIQTQIAGYLPHVSCVVIQGYGQQCQPAPPAQSITTTFTVTSPTTMEVEGSLMQRDPSGGLLNQPVPDTSVMAGAAPVQPNIPQPVMPQMHPYVTPNGPGNQMANAYHEQNRAWLDQNMRGCTIDQYGRRWGCQQ